MDQPIDRVKQLKNESFVKYQLIILLIEVADSYLKDFLADMDRVKLTLKQSEKMMFNNTVKTAKLLKNGTKQISEIGFTLCDPDVFCDDSDYFYQLLLLIADRLGNNPDKHKEIKEMIISLKSELDLFE